MQEHKRSRGSRKKDKEGTDFQSTNTKAKTRAPRDDMSSTAHVSGRERIGTPHDKESTKEAFLEEHPIADKNQVSDFLRSGVYRLAKLWIRLLSVLASTVFLGVLSVAVGLGSWAPPPILDLVHQHPTASVVSVGLFTFVSFLAWFISRGAVPKADEIQPSRKSSQYNRRLITATATSTASSILCIVLVAVVLIRPTWCPTFLCPTPPLPSGAVIGPDHNLAAYFQTIQSPYYVIPDDPASYTLGKLPTAIPALRIDDSTQGPYRVVIGIHSLQQGSFGLIIEQVVLVVKQVTEGPYPLRVWAGVGEQRDFHSNIFQVLYSGQEAGAAISAGYVREPGHVQLIPGEADELDIQTEPRLKRGVDLQFQVQITYRVVNESQEQTVRLPNVFEVVFSDKSNWYPYHLYNGHFVAGP